MQKTMQAAIAHQFGSPLKIEQVPIPEVTPGKILVKILASGVCHTDLHAINGDWPVKPTLPFIPGHEGAGIVVAVGEGVKVVKEGDRVGVPWLHTACGYCSYCLTGWETLCETQQNTGYSVNGCFAEYVLADPNYVGQIPAQLNFVSAASILCAGVTVYKGIKETQAKPGEWIAIWGLGGLGHLAIQYAHAMGLHVVAVDINQPQLELAKVLKAEMVINANQEDVIKKINDEIKGVHATLVTAVSEIAFSQAIKVLRRHGTAVFVGLPAGDFNLSIFDVVLNRKTIRGSIVGTRQDLAESLSFAAEGKVAVHYQVDYLKNINSIFAKMKEGDIRGRIVMKINEDDTLYPYPNHLISSLHIIDNKIKIRPAKSEDGELIRNFSRNLSSQTKHTQFMENFKELSREVIKQLTHFDYEHEMVLIATIKDKDIENMIGMARYVVNPDGQTCEVIVVVADEWQKKKIATNLMQSLIKIAQSKGLKAMTGMILSSDYVTLKLAKTLGFTISSGDEPTVKMAIKILN